MLVNRRTRVADPVVISRIIASSLLNDLQSSNGARVEPLSVLNVLRLLDVYESQSFSVPQPLGILQHDDFADLNGRRGVVDLKRLKSALAVTHQSFLPQSSESEFAQRARDLFRPFISNEDDATNRAERVPEANRFLRKLTEALQAV